ncbi:MAG: 5-formyltetrahydrofolate cyclo-ligase [Firmicutes bacterium]|nr:5-formyltetrahydrofolate cyclo-ligase [Bacillota bacterium]
MSTVHEGKTLLRREIKARAKALTSEYKASASEAIYQALIDTAEYEAANTVMLYLHMGNEPSTTKLLEKLPEDGKRACIPLCTDTEGHIMVAKLYTGKESLAVGAYGIMEPAADAEEIEPEEIDLIVTPCVSCDRECRRLGHGAGYYDRYIPKADCPVIAVCYEELMSEEVPVDEYDHPMDAVITEVATYRK